jgi:sugar phosphate isomerase/epimerase
MPQLIMHVNYFESGYDLSVLFDKACQYGYDGVELRGFKPDLSTADYLKAVKTEWDRTGLATVIMACPCNLNQPEASDRAAEIEKCSDLLRQAAAIGVNLCNAMAGPMLAEGIPYYEFHRHGSGVATWEQWAWGVEGFQQLGAVAEEVGMRLAFETHNGYIHDLARPTAEFVRRINSPAVGANLDLGNIVLNSQGEGVAEACEALAGCLYYTHLKNIFKPSQGGYVICGLADGVIDNRLFMRCLQAQGYEAPLCLEAPRQGDRDFFAKEDIAYLRSVLADLGWS